MKPRKKINKIVDHKLSDILLDQLDKWIIDCQLQADVFFQRGMNISEASSLAMKVAYMNVKDLVHNSIIIQPIEVLITKDTCPHKKMTFNDAGVHKCSQCGKTWF